MKREIADIVTDRLIEALEQGIAPWTRPWKSVGDGPTSLATGKPYQGINTLLLETTAMLFGYTSQHWATYKQIESRGGNVRKGEKGTPVVLWKRVAKKDEQGEEKTFSFLRYFTVFNLDQCEGVEAPASEPLPVFVPIERAEEIAAKMPHRPEVKTGGNRAYYSPGLDYVQMPPQAAFESPEAYYGVLFHELGHATGHESRLNRDSVTGAATFGDEVYAQEELVAEITSAIVCAEARIEPNIPRSAAYVSGWLRYAQDNRKELLKAASAAQKAADFIVGSKEEAA
jgi:antirestriction protein ArdC